MFDVRHLTHSYETEEGEKFTALCDVSCKIRKGEFTAVIGTNGSGKSTLARHLNALILPTEGDILVEGMSVMIWTISGPSARRWAWSSRIRTTSSLPPS